MLERRHRDVNNSRIFHRIAGEKASRGQNFRKITIFAVYSQVGLDASSPGFAGEILWSSPAILERRHGGLSLDKFSRASPHDGRWRETRSLCEKRKFRVLDEILSSVRGVETLEKLERSYGASYGALPSMSPLQRLLQHGHVENFVEKLE